MSARQLPGSQKLVKLILNMHPSSNIDRRMEINAK